MYSRKIVLVSIGLLTCVSSLSAARPRLTASLEVSADAVQPEGAPVLLLLTVRNTGQEPISYWCGGPGEFPDAGNFSVDLERVDGIHFHWPERKPLSNGQNLDAAGRLNELATGQSIRVPVAMQPLPHGIYRVLVAGDADGRIQNGAIRFVTWPATRASNAVTIEIRDDEKLAATRDVQTIARVRANDSFAKHLALTWHRQPVRDALIDDLMGENAVKADRAIEGLWGDAAPPTADALIVVKAIMKHLKPADEGSDIGLMTRLVEAAKETRASDGTAAIARLALSRPPGRVQELAIDGLEVIKKEKDGSNIGELAESVIVEHDDADVEVLSKLAGSADPAQRKLAFGLLGLHPNNAVAEKVLRAGLADRDWEASKAADKNLTHILWLRATRGSPATTRP